MVIVEDHWSHLVHQLWKENSPSVVLTVRDIAQQYLKKKKKFKCSQNVYWLGEKKPPKKLKSLGNWKPVPTKAERPFALKLYRAQ